VHAIKSCGDHTMVTMQRKSHLANIFERALMSLLSFLRLTHNSRTFNACMTMDSDQDLTFNHWADKHREEHRDAYEKYLAKERARGQRVREELQASEDEDSQVAAELQYNTVSIV